MFRYDFFAVLVRIRVWVLYCNELFQFALSMRPSIKAPLPLGIKFLVAINTLNGVGKITDFDLK